MLGIIIIDMRSNSILLKVFTLLFFSLLSMNSTFQAEEKKISSKCLYPISIDGKWGYINNKGLVVIKPQFDMAFAFDNNNLTRVKVGSKLGFIDKYGNFVIKPIFDRARDFNEGLAVVKDSEKGYYYINNKGIKAFPDYYDHADSFSDGYALVEKK